jgi:hypothetical protein
MKLFYWTLAGIFVATFIVGFTTPLVAGTAGILLHPHIFGIATMLITGGLLATLIYFKQYKDDGRAGSISGHLYPGWVMPMLLCTMSSSFLAGAELAALIHLQTGEGVTTTQSNVATTSSKNEDAPTNTTRTSARSVTFNGTSSVLTLRQGEAAHDTINLFTFRLVSIAQDGVRIQVTGRHGASTTTQELVVKQDEAGQFLDFWPAGYVVTPTKVTSDTATLSIVLQSTD